MSKFSYWLIFRSFFTLVIVKLSLISSLYAASNVDKLRSRAEEHYDAAKSAIKRTAKHLRDKGDKLLLFHKIKGISTSHRLLASIFLKQNQRKR